MRSVKFFLMVFVLETDVHLFIYLNMKLFFVDQKGALVTKDQHLGRTSSITSASKAMM